MGEYPNSMYGEKAYSPKEIADMLGMNVQVVRRHLRDGKMPHYKPYAKYIITETQLRKYLEGDKNE